MLAHTATLAYIPFVNHKNRQSNCQKDCQKECRDNVEEKKSSQLGISFMKGPLSFIYSFGKNFLHRGRR